MLKYILATALALAGTTANAAEIVRHKMSDTALILKGVTVPAGSETVYLSGQIANPIDPSKKMTDIKGYEDLGDTRTQTVSALNKIKAELAELGYTMSDIIKLTVFVVGDPKLGGRMDFAGMNDGFKQFFLTSENPNTVARSTIQVAGLAGPYFLVEIEATAAKAR